jgi:hypothetical protein
MGAPRVAKRQLEKARQEKAAAKRERRQNRTSGEVAPDAEDLPPARAEDVILSEIGALHDTFASGSMTFEEFEARRDELTAELSSGLSR